ncbi:acyltransferase family protein [Pedococcus sp. 5OH_020]|uniref:acyltransferase family protein n=1 Tax=Pedococcus sp. 5OH_020 TaxID=2989814 RepID=UPI0022E99C7D|nr:acyltransferase [Pedococcus sp. 5OH_020]
MEAPLVHRRHREFVSHGPWCTGTIMSLSAREPMSGHELEIVHVEAVQRAVDRRRRVRFPFEPRRETPVQGEDRVPVPYEEYLGRRYFTPLDGLRALSILLVVTDHTTDPLFGALHGAVGVTIFFVISGYLISTLLLRDEERRGAARIPAFYIRRAYRILPLYYLTLGAYIILVGVLHLQAGASSLWRSMPWFLTYQNDLAPVPPVFVFGHSWSLAIEEKYYLLWPLMFAIPLLRRHRLRVTGSLVVLTAVGSLWSATFYFATYTPILLGCVMALVLHNPSLYTWAARLARTDVALLLIGALIAWELEFENGSQVHIVFAVLTALLLPSVLLGPRWLSTVLSHPVAAYIGTRSYAVYLIHRIAKGTVDRVVGPGSTSIPHQLTHFLLIVVISLLAAEIMHRLIEQPMIQRGRRLASTGRKARTVPVAAPGEGLDPAAPAQESA